MLSPQRRSVPASVREQRYWTRLALELPPPLPPRRDFFRVLDRRRSARPVRPLVDSSLSTLLWYTAKDYSHIGRPGGSTYWLHRAVPSAGGAHPIDLIVGWHGRWRYYSARRHALFSLARAVEDALGALRQDMFICAGGEPLIDSTPIWFVAQTQRLSARYQFSESLLWRDAGVVLGALCAVAAALSVAAQPIGRTGDPCVRLAFRAYGSMVGAGGVLLGRRE